MLCAYMSMNENCSPALSENKSFDKSHSTELFPVPSGCETAVRFLPSVEFFMSLQRD